MKRLAFTLAAIGLLSGASVAPASVAPQRIEHRPYAHLNTPPEATTAATGGPGVVLAEQVKSTVRVEFTGGAPCGPMPGYDDNPFGTGGPGGPANPVGVWVAAGVGVVAVAGIAVVGFVLLRRSKV
jgi:hypothetical protein